MIIIKFGGTSVGSASQIRKAAKIVESQLSKNPLVIVSALSGVTDQLLNKLNIANLKERHLAVIQELQLPLDILTQEFEELEALFKKMNPLQEVTPRIQDRILSFGERASSKIVGSFLNKVLSKPVVSIFSYDLGLKTNSNFGQAAPLKEYYSDIKKKVSHYKNKIIVTTGFIAKDKDGNITTLGRGGSDYSASLFGAALDCKEIQIWTDVSGIMTADPKVVPEATPIPKMSFEEAGELSYYGAKVIHPSTMLPAMEKNIPVRILNTNAPHHLGTLIYYKTKKKEGSVKAIAHRCGLTIINITSTRMLDQHGFLAKIFDIFSHHKISVDMVSTSEVSVSTTIDKNQGLKNLVSQLKTFSDVSVEKNHSIISIVGLGVREDSTVSARVFNILNKTHIPVRMISLGASKINLSFLVEEKFTQKAVRTLHDEFFK